MNLHRVVESAAFSQRTVDLTLHQSAGADLHERLLQSLEYAWSALAHMVCLEPNDHFQVADYREQLNEAIHALRGMDVRLRNIGCAQDLVAAIAELKVLGETQVDPVGAAKAFESLFRGLAELSRELPTADAAEMGLFAEAERFFEDLGRQFQHVGFGHVGGRSGRESMM